MNVAVVGAGIFGVACADELARRGHRVTVFEAGSDIMQAASAINQYRLHRGYHYPRRADTAQACRDSEQSFRSVYGQAVIDHVDRHYAIAASESLTGASAFLEFCERLALPFRLAHAPFLAPDSVELCIRVTEGLLDLELLRRIAWERLRSAGVDVRLEQATRLSRLHDFDTVVVCAYARINEVLDEGEGLLDYQFEVVEKPIVRPTPALAGQSVVVLDGPFMCMDPYGATGLSVLGHVVHAIHHRNVGRLPEIPARLVPLLNRGLVERPPLTRFQRFVEAGSRFLPEMAHLEHVGSLFTVRTVIPGLDDTDARPTLVRAIRDGVITVFSGKIGTCIQAAEDVAALVEGRSERGEHEGSLPAAASTLAERHRP